MTLVCELFYTHENLNGMSFNSIDFYAQISTYACTFFSGSVTQSFFLAPAVAPWETTLDGVMGGPGNNPAIRLVKYHRSTGEVLDIHQYYLHLDEANQSGNDTWQLEYIATEYYNQPDLTSCSLARIAEELWDNDELFTKYYLANGVRYDPDEVWDNETRIVHVCSMMYSHYDDYQQCYDDHMYDVSSSNVMLIASWMSLVLFAYLW